MDSLNHTISSPRARITQRRPQACTECARRKLRCSKVIPCGACMDRGIGHSCHRENVRVRNKKTKNSSGVLLSNADSTSDNVEQREAGKHHTSRPNTPSTSCLLGPPFTQEDAARLLQHSAGSCAHSFSIMPGSSNDQPAISPTVAPSEALNTPGSSSEEQLSPGSSSLTRCGLINGIAQDSAVTLEFLALSRQRVMRLGHGLAAESPGSLGTTFPNIADPILTPAQIRWLVDYHDRNISWMHNVLHMGTFRKECEAFLGSGTLMSPLWRPLYYTVLSVSFLFI